MSSQTLSLSFSPRLLLRKVVAAAEISRFRIVRRWVAVYRQFRFAAVVRQRRTDKRWRLDPAAKLQEPVESIRFRHWIGERHWRQFHAEGYMVIRNVVSPDIITSAVREIAAFVGADLADNATWYGGDPQLDGVVPMHHAQSLWDIRQCPNLYHVFTEFFGTKQLMVDINRCIFRPPVHQNWPAVSHGSIHWDTDPRLGPESLQAVVLLTDVGRNGGGFQCLPNIYRNLDAWLERYALRDDFDHLNPGLNDWKTTQVESKAGDVILWSTKLPHGTATNLSKRPRMAMFVSMTPPGDNAQFRGQMKTWWLTKRAPDQWRGLPGQFDAEPGDPAVLSELGLKLIGVLPWQ